MCIEGSKHWREQFWITKTKLGRYFLFNLYTWHLNRSYLATGESEGNSEGLGNPRFHLQLCFWMEHGCVYCRIPLSSSATFHGSAKRYGSGKLSWKHQTQTQSLIWQCWQWRHCHLHAHPLGNGFLLYRFWGWKMKHEWNIDNNRHK